MNRFYQDAIHEIDSTINPAGVEATMRLQFGTLNHLDQNVFAVEIKLAHECEREEPGFLKEIARSYGMVSDFDYWQDKLSGLAEGDRQ